MFSIPKCSTRIYNKQRRSVKHDIRIIDIFIDLAPKVNKYINYMNVVFEPKVNKYINYMNVVFD